MENGDTKATRVVVMDKVRRERITKWTELPGEPVVEIRWARGRIMIRPVKNL
jgi:hypothetical protein